MIDAAVQRDVDGISKGSHDVRILIHKMMAGGKTYYKSLGGMDKISFHTSRRDPFHSAARTRRALHFRFGQHHQPFRLGRQAPLWEHDSREPLRAE